MSIPLPPLPPLPPQAPWPGARLTRRGLIKLAGASGLCFAGGAWLYQAFWKLGPPAPGRVCLNADEMAICEKAAEAFFPGPPASPLSASEVNLSQFLDAYLGGLYEDNIRLFKLLFRAVDLSPLLSHGRSFCKLPLEQRIEVLGDWAESTLLARRAGYESLRFFCSLGYFEDPRVQKALGLSLGCDLSGREEPAGAPLTVGRGAEG